MPLSHLTTPTHLSRAVDARVRSTCVVARHRWWHDERGEGVISAAIVVLIMAILGAMMWVAFKEVFQGATENTKAEIGKIHG